MADGVSNAVNEKWQQKPYSGRPGVTMSGIPVSSLRGIGRVPWRGNAHG